MSIEPTLAEKLVNMCAGIYVRHIYIYHFLQANYSIHAYAHSQIHTFKKHFAISKRMRTFAF